MKHLLYLLIAFGLLSSCVAPPTKEAQTLVVQSYVCRLEKATGSNRPIRVCRSREQMDKEKAEAEEFIRRNERLGTLPTQ